MAETHRPWIGVGRIHGVKRKLLYIFTWVSLMAQLVKNPPAMQETWLGSIPRLGRSPGEENSYPLQYSGLENSMDCIVDGVAKSRTQLSDFNSVTCIFTLFWKGRERGSCLVGWPRLEVQQP